MFSFLINWNFILPMNKLVSFLFIPKSNALQFSRKGKTETEYMGRYLDKFANLYNMILSTNLKNTSKREIFQTNEDI